MAGSIQNRESFLNQIADRLGRSRMSKVEKPVWKFAPQNQVMNDKTQDELADVLAEQCKSVHTDFYKTDQKNLPAILREIVKEYGGGLIVSGKDERYAEWRIRDLLEEWPEKEGEVYFWDYENGAENIRNAEKANVGIAISEMTLAESGTVVIYNHAKKGRTINFLPAAFIALVPKSTIVPRMTQAARKLREMETLGGELPSCINFITGPSNSADIELNLVVGVHGPIKASYIIITDL